MSSKRFGEYAYFRITGLRCERVEVPSRRHFKHKAVRGSIAVDEFDCDPVDNGNEALAFAEWLDGNLSVGVTSDILEKSRFF